MGHKEGRISEIRLGSGRHIEVHIACPDDVIPSAGQYTLAAELDNADVVLSTPVFLVGKTGMGFWAAAGSPVKWQPGANVNLVGPLGHGFNPPRAIQRLGFVALGETVSRLMPLVHDAARSKVGMTLFTDLTVPNMPVAVEVYPLASLKDALDWPDFLAMDVPLLRLDGLREMLGSPPGSGLACPAQVLVTAAMPCAGIGQCGACAIQARRGWKLICEDGPVFDLHSLKW